MEERNPTTVGAVRTPTYIFALLVALGGACTLTTNLGSLEGGQPPADDDGATHEGTGAEGDTVAASTGSGLQEDDDGGAAGVGGAGSSGGAGGSSAATGGSGGAGPVECPATPNCAECVMCAEAGPCKPQLDACIADPYCEPLLTCVWSCPVDNTVCVDDCHYYYGGAAAWAKYDQMTYCISCQQCTVLCPGWC
jgi:hypothetical protein